MCCSCVHDVILIEYRLEERPHSISRYLASLAKTVFGTIYGEITRLDCTSIRRKSIQTTQGNHIYHTLDS